MGIKSQVGNIEAMKNGKFEDLKESELKHLEFIQGIIARLAGNSFFLKGWSVTLVAAIIALAARDSSAYFVLIAILPALAFWGLDAFYVGQERLFRNLHKDVVARKVDAFLLDVHSYETGWKGWIQDLKSRSVWPFHVPVVAVVIVVAIIN